MRHIFIGMDYLIFTTAGWRTRCPVMVSRPVSTIDLPPLPLRPPMTRRSAEQDPTPHLSMRIIAGLILALSYSLSIEAEEAAGSQSAAVVPALESGVRLKDLCEIYGVRDNQLHGIGVVVGLGGTGDKTAATVRMLKQMLATKKLSFPETELNSKNVAMVAITADLPAFARNGSRLYTQVSCLGDASSLKGGILLQTPLVAADGRIYAVAQGTVSIGGFGNAGPGLVQGGVDHKNIETVGALPSGALVEREVPVSLLYGDRLRLVLKDADFTTASRVSRALSEVFGAARVNAEDATMITLSFVTKPSDSDLVETIARLQQVRVSPDIKARVVVNSRTGTVVAGNQVRISEVAVSHAGLSLRVMPMIQRRPDPDNRGGTITSLAWVDPVTRIRSDQPPAGLRPTTTPGTLTVMSGVTVDDIANALNALGARPRDLVAIFEAIQRAGALHAELVVM